MANTKRTDWARQQRIRAMEKRRANGESRLPSAPPVAGKPVSMPAVAPPRTLAIDVPIIVPVTPKAPGPKPEQRVDHRLPYTKSRGEYLCEVCGHTLKTEAGIVTHVRAKHPEVGL